MASPLFAVTGSLAGSIRESLHTLQIIPKSTSAPSAVLIRYANHHRRILLASIRKLGGCPCPRCLIPLHRVPNMGMRRDMLQRVRLLRVDDNARRSKVSATRKLIYEKNYSVNAAAVESLLKYESLVPTSVRCPLLIPFIEFIVFCIPRMHFQIASQRLDSSCSRCSS